MAMFNSYVKLPEATQSAFFFGNHQTESHVLQHMFINAMWTRDNVLSSSMDWLKGTSTGNHVTRRFSGFLQFFPPLPGQNDGHWWMSQGRLRVLLLSAQLASIQTGVPKRQLLLCNCWPRCRKTQPWCCDHAGCDRSLSRDWDALRIPWLKDMCHVWKLDPHRLFGIYENILVSLSSKLGCVVSGFQLHRPSASIWTHPRPHHRFC